MTAQQPILIVGGGLAGLIAAIDLALRGYSVQVLEQKSYPRHKVCGEFVSTEVLPYLKRLGAYPASHQPPLMDTLQITATSGRKLRSPLDIPSFGISRYTWDSFLLRRARDLGVQVVTGCKVQDIHFQKDHFSLSDHQGNHYQSTVVLAAYGKQHRWNSHSRGAGRYLGLKMHYRAPWPAGEVHLHNFKGGYCGVSPVEEGRINLCYLVERRAVAHYAHPFDFHHHGLSQNPFLEHFLHQAEPLFAKPLTISQIDFSPRPVVQEHQLLLGDAAGLIHPFCGNGMAMAVGAARLAVVEVDRFCRGLQSREEMEQRYQSQWKHAFARRLRVGRWARPLFGRRKLTDGALQFFDQQPAMLKRALKYAHGPEIS